MNTYKFDGYTMTLQALNRRDRHNHIMVKYTFATPEGELLFSGEDLGASPLHAPESLESARVLLSFLTLKPGDTDAEYFENYTPRQLEFTESMDIENLAIYTEEGDDNFDNFASKMED